MSCHCFISYTITTFLATRCVALLSPRSCALEVARFVNLLLVLIFGGRRALPKAGAHLPQFPSLHRSNITGSERNHFQVIEFIRNKDTAGLIEAIESGEQHLPFSLASFLLFFCPFDLSS